MFYFNPGILRYWHSEFLFGITWSVIETSIGRFRITTGQLRSFFFENQTRGAVQGRKNERGVWRWRSEEFTSKVSLIHYKLGMLGGNILDLLLWVSPVLPFLKLARVSSRMQMKKMTYFSTLQSPKLPFILLTTSWWFLKSKDECNFSLTWLHGKFALLHSQYTRHHTASVSFV